MNYVESSELRELHDPSVEDLIVDGLVAIGGEIHPEESMAYGVSDSAHHVYFGSRDGMPVAIKPFWGLEGAHRAFHEEALLRYAQNKGVQSLHPIGVFEGQLGNYLVTNYEDGLASMNQVGWEQSVNSAIYINYHLPLIKQMGKFVRRVHEAGIVHCDLQLKNFAKKRSGEFVLIDLEKARLTKGLDDDERAGLESADIERLVSSLLQKHFLPHRKRGEVHQSAQSSLYSAYGPK